MSGVHIIHRHILTENKSQSFAFSVLSNNLDLTFISVENRPLSKDYHFAYFELIILKVELSQCESRNLFNLDYYPIWWPDKEPAAGFCCAWYNPTTRVNNPGKKNLPKNCQKCFLIGPVIPAAPLGARAPVTDRGYVCGTLILPQNHGRPYSPVYICLWQRVSAALTPSASVLGSDLPWS